MVRPRNKVEQPTVSDMLLIMQKKFAQQSRKPDIFGYQPHFKQECFHKAMQKLLLYIGGNRSGKSYGAVAQDIFYVTGLHPYVEIPQEQIRGRVVAVDFERGVKEIILPIFKILCPPTLLKGGSWDKAWKESERKLYFKYYDSYIEFMSYEQETEKFAGTSRHFIHYDEEPPMNVFNECQARLVDTNGRAWISMTPVEGMTWLYDRIYQPAEEADDRKVFVEGNAEIGPVWEAYSQRISIIEVGMNENPHLTEEAREDYLRTLDADDRAARSKGHFVQTAGKVFKSFQAETHVNHTDIDPKRLQQMGWQIYSSTDHGWNNPTAWLWHAVAPLRDGRVITFGEHYASEMLIEDHAKKVIAMETAWGLDREEIIRTGDPAMHQKNAITGTSIIKEYAKHGLYIYTGSVPKDPAIGIGRMQQYFRLREWQRDGQTVEQPTWMIDDACPNLIKELKNLRWKVYSSKKVRYDNNPQEEVHKKDDHAFDSAKYFATFLMELAPDVITKSLGPTPARMDYDDNLVGQLNKRDEEETVWTVVETY